MCGIFGSISKKDKPFNKRAFCTMGVRNDTRGGDSCGIFIDGKVEYGVDSKKLFMSFFRESLLLNTTTECRIALGHCRKASIGKVSVETAQPVCLYNEAGEIEYVLIHNGTIYNYQELAKKYIPDVNIEGLTDSQVMARIFYHKGYDVLDEYQGGAVFVMHDYREDRTLIFKGHSKKFATSLTIEEERPLYYCWHNGRFVFSSIFETLYAFYYEEDVYNLPFNKLMVIKKDKLKLVKEYNRENCSQSRVNSSYVSMYEDTYYGYKYDPKENYSYKIGFKNMKYVNAKGEPLHGVFHTSSYGYIYPNKTVKKPNDTWIHTVGFFQGKMLKHPKAFILINKLYQENNKVISPELEILINMMDFNPHTEDNVQFYWYDNEVLMIPQGEWKWPMVDKSYVFDDEGIMVKEESKAYYGWTTDYNMYTYEEEAIVKAWKLLCEGE